MPGHVYKSAKGWRVLIDIGPDPRTGKRRQRRFGPFRTRRDAERKAANVVTEVATGDFVEPSTITLETYLRNTWLPSRQARRLRANTLNDYAWIIDTYISPQLGHRPIGELTADDVMKFLTNLVTGKAARRGKPLSARTVRYAHTVLSMALDDAVRWETIQRNVAKNVKADLPRLDRPEATGWWSLEQLNAFLIFAKDDNLYPLWHLDSTTGLRREEITALHWEYVDLENESLDVRRTRVMVGSRVREDDLVKTSSSYRTVALDPTTCAVLVEHRKAQQAEAERLGDAWEGDGHVFTNPSGNALVPDSLSKRFQALREESGLPHITFHGLRHSYATASLQAGVEISIVSRRLGHRSTTITRDIYQHYVPALDEEAADRVATLITGSRPTPTPPASED